MTGNHGLVSDGCCRDGKHREPVHFPQFVVFDLGGEDCVESIEACLLSRMSAPHSSHRIFLLPGYPPGHCARDELRTAGTRMVRTVAIPRLTGNHYRR